MTTTDTIASGDEASIAFLCPNEPHASSLAEALRGLAGHDTILISRDVVEAHGDNVRAEVSNTSPLHENFEKAAGKLRGLSDLARRVSRLERPQVVLLDDVLLICPLAKELHAALIAFDIDPNADEDRNYGGHKVFFRDIERTGRKPVSVAISVVTKPRNVPASIVTTELSYALRPSAVLLAGIGGGVKTKTHLGDVVVATKIRDVAGGRQEPTRKLTRDEVFDVPGPTSSQLNYFLAKAATERSWRPEAAARSARLRELGMFEMPDSASVESARFKVLDGIVVAGETLVGDGSLPAHIEDRDDRIRSCDMEGSGFAQAADARRLQWGLFRGVSDFGDPDKTNEWQAVAAVCAALAARRFLETEYRLPSEMSSIGF